MNTFDVYFEKGKVEGRVEGRVEGIEEGIEKGKEEIVRNLITSKQFTSSQIANFAGVPESFVEKIQSDIKRI